MAQEPSYITQLVWDFPACWAVSRVIGNHSFPTYSLYTESHSHGKVSEADINEGLDHYSPCLLQMSLECNPGRHIQPRVWASGPPPWGPPMTRLHTWLAHALLDSFQPCGSQGSGLLRKAAVSLLSQLPEAGSRWCAGLTLHTDRRFLKAVSETEIVTDRVLPAFGSCPEKGEVFSVDREENKEGCGSSEED